MFRSQKRDGMLQNDFQVSVQSCRLDYSFCIADEEKEPVLVRSLFICFEMTGPLVNSGQSLGSDILRKNPFDSEIRGPRQPPAALGERV